MNIILLTKSGGKPICRQLSSSVQFMFLGVCGLLFSAGLIYAGFWWGISRNPEIYVQRWRGELEIQRNELDQVRAQAHADIEALTLRLGQMQGYVSRLDALGQKLVKMAKLDPEEFNFAAAPALGGPESTDDISALAVPELRTAIAALEDQLVTRDSQLSVLEQLIMNRNLEAEVFPSGRPVHSGWLSSGYGVRASPFDGNSQFHKGLDFAGHEGQDIIAVAGGMVTFSGEKYGYGNLIEIYHGNGYATRYGHNKKNLVKEGQAVKKGELIALMGSTGRSTGFHVHFEVLKDGRQINPSGFVQASK